MLARSAMSAILTFEEAGLTQEDICLFAARQGWLNASNIHFALRRLEHRLGLPKKIMLMDPILQSFMRSQMEDADEVSDFLAGIEFAARDWLILPCNDATSARGGGSHWSLLAFHIASNRALHLDSSAGHNNSEAAKSLASILSSLSSHPPALVQDLEAPVQRDGSSCGVFSCMFAEFLASKLSHHQQPDFDIFAPAKWLEELCAVVSQDSVGVWREAVVADIERLCAERER